MEEKKIVHWADKYADRVIQKKEKDMYIVESGITPSGVVHAGNFREVMTQDLVFRALKDKKVNVTYQYFWDDYDRFRKVPKGIPEKWEEYIGVPVCKVPDPFKCHDSYAEHYEASLIEETEKLGVECEYVHASKEYAKGIFADLVKKALENSDKIREIINKFRKEPRPEDWLPVEVYCEKCGKDTTHVKYEGEYEVSYTCDCGHSDKYDFRKTNNVKLRWRIDWPMRWTYYDIDFESSGKEHHASGGSVDTADLICKEVFEHVPPIEPMYEFIYFKGQKEKMSSSKGNVITISKLLEIFEPEVLRYIYTARINRAIDLPFDADVLNIYNYYDLAERMYFNKVENKDENEIRKYELSQINIPKEYVPRVEFAVCANIMQVALGNIDKAIEVLVRTGHVKQADVGLRKRLQLAYNWVQKYAPEDMRFTLQEQMPSIQVDVRIQRLLEEAANQIEKGINADELQVFFYNESKERNLPMKQVFSSVYKLFLNKEKGPRLGPFLASLDKEFVVNRLRMKK